MKQRNKSLVIFCPTRSWGGIEKNVRLRAQYFGKKGFPVHVILLQNKFKEHFSDLQNVTTLSVEKRGGDINVFVLLRYVRILGKIEPYTVFCPLKRDWWLVTLAASITKVPNIVLYLGNKRKIRKGFKYKMVFDVLKAKMLVNSDSLKEHLYGTTPFFADHNLFRIYNGIMLPDRKGAVRDYKRLLNLHGAPCFVGCAGWLNIRKGFDLLPGILRMLPEHIHIVHVGKDGFEISAQELLDNNKDISHRLHFMGYEADMNAFFRGIDLFLLCSRSEGMANVLLEALSHGKPIVSTKVPGSAELLDHGTYGILTAVEDTKAMAEGILSIHEKKIVFPTEMLHQRISEVFSLEHMMVNTESLFFDTH